MTDNKSLSDAGLRAADMIKSGRSQDAAIERSPGIWECRGIGNSYLLSTSEGGVLVNAGTLGDARRGHPLFARVSAAPIRYIILTQSHANQFGGLEIYKTPDNLVIAHKNYPAERVYTEMLSRHYRRGSRRIFGGMTGRTEDIVPTQEVAPDLLIGDEGHALEIGGQRIEIIWTPGGETRSAVIVWLPAPRIAIVGNLFGPLFGNHPNLNTLRGDKPRSAREFIDSAKKLRSLNPEMILTGHEAIQGAATIEKDLTRIISSVQWVHDRTVEGMNEGKPLRSLMLDIKTPPELTLTEEYGKVAWNVRAIWHEYTGWFDPSKGTTEIFGVASSSVAPAIVQLAGGVDRVAERARVFVENHEPLQALHLLDIALAAQPDCPLAREVRADALRMLSQQIDGKNLWERMWIAADLRDLDVG